MACAGGSLAARRAAMAALARQGAATRTPTPAAAFLASLARNRLANSAAYLPARTAATAASQQPVAAAVAAATAATPATAALPAVRVLDEHSAPAALEGVSTLIFDCDGVLWRGNELIHNAPEALRVFRRQGRRLMFVTNNSSKSREQYVSKFASLGLEVAKEEIVASSYAAAAYLASRGFGPAAPGRKVLLLGWTGCELELQEAGIPYVGGREFEVPPLHDVAAMEALQVDPAIRAVVVGWDPAFSYARLVYASVCLRELPGVALVATNTDHADHIGGGRMMPGTGGLVAAVEAAAGVRAVNVGKGGDWLLPYLCRKYGLDPRTAAIVGDRLDTDIALGRAGGLRTVLPLTGVTRADDVAALAAAERPDAVVGSVAQLAGLAAA